MAGQEAAENTKATPEPSPLARAVTRSLRRARKAYGSEAGNSAEAMYHLQEAQTLAMMDLAEAIREGRPSD